MAMRISALPITDTSQDVYTTFLDALTNAGFKGEIARGQASRIVFATDNSIYQRAPQAVLFPKDDEDVAVVLRLAGKAAFRDVVFAPRGGGTGTNGQSLTDGVVLDLSRHMNKILEINVEERWARVQPGVVKDQLNAELKAHGLFFAPELSTSNRATIGGMVNTDASGQGSCTYGKTRDHVLQLKTMLLGGDEITSFPLDSAELKTVCASQTRHGRIAGDLLSIAQENRQLIDNVFPDLNRCLTGYDLKHLLTPEGALDINSLFCGSEGTLGVMVEIKLNLLPIPRYVTLVNLRYKGFMDALRDAGRLMTSKPISIETIDSRVLSLATQDIVWQDVSDFFPSDADRPTLGINIVEFSDDDAQQLEKRVTAFTENLIDETTGCVGYTLAQGRVDVNRVYSMRKRAVGLLGNVTGEARPQPFVEDTAVPPKLLADYIAEFRALLDQHGLQYGMFGHVDAGVLHVRPLLNLRETLDVGRIRVISDEVVRLTRKYGGLLWGEHGKGLRSEYVPDYFGPLYPALQKVKSLFDPFNQLNPGKIATPLTLEDARISRVDEVTLRGQFDREIPQSTWESYGAAMHCNGNGACYNFSVDDPMCPSWKASRDRRYAPKGRAQLMKEWLRLQARAGVDVLCVERAGPLSKISRFFRRLPREGNDFSHDVYQAMSTCLACKSCTKQCPVHVDIPGLRARFLSLYHTRFRRPSSDYLVAGLEPFLISMARLPRVYNRLVGHQWLKRQIELRLGLVDLPELPRINFGRSLRRHGVERFSVRRFQLLSAAERRKAVVFVADAFVSAFDAKVLLDAVRVARFLGYRAYVSPVVITGKPLQVYGFARLFNMVARHTARRLTAFAGSGVPLIGIDPALTLVYRQEYKQVEGVSSVPQVELVNEWLDRVTGHLKQPESTEGDDNPSHTLLLHCTEKTNLSQSSRQWQEIYKRFNLRLKFKETGCCGMSGAFGHETRNKDLSREIFNLSWGRRLEEAKSEIVVATGFSCRSQVKRFGNRELRHPISAIAASLHTTMLVDEKSQQRV